MWALLAIGVAARQQAARRPSEQRTCQREDYEHGRNQQPELSAEPASALYTKDIAPFLAVPVSEQHRTNTLTETLTDARSGAAPPPPAPRRERHPEARRHGVLDAPTGQLVKARSDAAADVRGTDGKLLMATAVLLGSRADRIRALVCLQRNHVVLDDGDQGINSIHGRGRNGHSSRSRDVIFAGQPGYGGLDSNPRPRDYENPSCDAY